eukprot:16452351-Heterocapsa_arctica.AAC.1
MFTRALCSVHHHFLARFRRFPYRLFLLLEDASQAAAIAGSCHSSHDQFTADFIRRHSPDLVNPVALAELVMIVMVARVVTVLLECRNAQIRRYVEVMSVHTTSPTLSLISAKFLLRKLALRERLVKQPPGFRRVRQRLTRARAEKAKAQGQRSKKRVGGGGAWRAFINDRCKGVCKSVFATLAQQYEQLAPEEKQRFVDFGALAALAHRDGATSFGQAARAMGRAMARDESHCRALAISQGSMLKPFIQVATLCQGRSLAVASRQLRADMHLLRRIRREELHARAEAIAEFRTQGAGMARRDKFLALVPVLAPMAAGLVGQPHGGGDIFLDWVCPAARLLPRMVALLRRPEHQKVVDGLLREWETKHQEVKHDSQTPLPAPAKKHPKPTCLDAGVCLCGLQGSLMLNFVRWLEGCLKGMPKEDSCMHALLNSCSIVVRVSKYAIPADEADGAAEGPQRLCDNFLCVGLMFWTPYRPTFRLCSLVSAAPDELGHLHLHCEDRYFDVYEFASEMKAELIDIGTWEFSSFEVCADSRPIVEIDPDHLVVRGVLGSQQKVLPQAPRRRKAKAASTTWSEALDEFPDRGEDEEEDEEEELGQDEEMGQEADEEEHGSREAEEDCVQSESEGSSAMDDRPFSPNLGGEATPPMGPMG